MTSTCETDSYPQSNLIPAEPMRLVLDAAVLPKGKTPRCEKARVRRGARFVFPIAAVPYQAPPRDWAEGRMNLESSSTSAWHPSPVTAEVETASTFFDLKSA